MGEGSPQGVGKTSVSRLGPPWSRPRPPRVPTRRRRRGAALLLAIAAGGALVWMHRDRPPSEHDLRTLATDGGKQVKAFDLRDAAGRRHSVADWAGRKGVVLGFLAEGDDAPGLSDLAQQYGRKGIAFYGIDVSPGATPDSVAGRSSQLKLPFPMLADPTQSVAAEAGVTATPSTVVLDSEGQVLYRGPAGHRDLRAALDATVADEMPAVARTEIVGRPLPSMGRSAGDEGPITFSKQVAPILWKNCAGCHRPGEVAPFPLLTYRDAARRAGFLRQVAESRQMPPWKPEPGFGTFFDAHRLTDREIATLAEWADAGAPEGDPVDLPAAPRFTDGWQLGRPDRVVTMPEEYPVPASGADVYRAFVLPLPMERDRTVVAVEFRPGNRKVVHHARMFVDETDDSRRRDAADPGPGFFSGFGVGGVDIPHPSLGAWTPGMTPRLPPEGVGMVVKARSDLVLMVHYHPIGRPEVDRSSVGLHFREGPPTRALAGVVLSTPRIDIPAGRARHTIRLRTTIGADAHAYGITPHAHNLLREIAVTATLPDGTVRPLLWIKDWDFAWQDQYRFAKPVKLPRGTRIDLVAHFDNSEANPRNPFHPPRRVVFGPASTDEMLACHIELIPDRPDGYKAFKGKSTFGL